METTLHGTDKHQDLLDVLPQAALLVDKVGSVSYANEPCTALWGQPAAQLVGQNWMGLDTDLTLLRWKQMWRESQREHALSYHTHLLTDRELLRPVAVKLVSLGQDEALLLVEATLPATITEAQLELLSVDRGYWYYDHFAKACYFSAQCLRLVGLEADSMREVPLNELASVFQPVLGSKLFEQLFDQVLQAVRGNQSLEREVITPAGALNLRVESARNALHTAYVVGVVEAAASEGADQAALDIFARFSLDQTDELVLWSTIAGDITYANQSFCQRIGFTSKEVKEMQVSTFFVGSNEAQRLAGWKELRQKKQLQGEVEIKTRDGRHLPVTYRVYYLQTDSRELACIFLRDAGDLKQQQRLLQLTKFSTDKSPDLIFWTRPDGSFVYVNECAAEALQYDAKKFEDLKIKTVAPYFDVPTRMAFWERLRRDERFTGEYELTRRDGSTFLISANVNYLQFEGEEIACSFGRNISVDKLAERRRRLSEFTVDHSHELILWVRPDGHIHFANQTFLERTGYTATEVEEAPITRFFPDYTEAGRDRLWNNLREKKHFGLETKLALKNGQTIPIFADFNYLLYEGQEFDCAFLRDWSKKHERDAQLELAHAVMDTAREAVLWLEEDLRVRYLNRSLLELLGGKEEDWHDQKMDKVLPGLNFSDLEGEEAVEHNLPTVAGHTVYLEWSRSVVELNDDMYYSLVGRNITERVLRRKELEQAYARIEEMSSRLQEENLVLREERNLQYDIHNIVTVSPAYQKVLHQVSQVAETDTTVLITGETGTGKELLARAVHNLSERKDFPLIKVNCAALPENLIESELFGHEQGAFTGAQERKKGRFELANGGTILLDEIGELPLALQAKLLRVLQEGEFERVGGTQSIQVDVRLIAATNRDLAEMVRNKHFRPDLFYRINVFPIRNMPLRERPEDIKVLTEYFVQRFARAQGKEITQVSSTDLEKLENYSFPGNVRELENIIERAVVLCRSKTLRIPFDKQNVIDLEQDHFLTFDEMQRQYIIDALKKTGGRITGPEGAGRILGLNDRTLMSKMRKFQIEKREYIV